MRGLIEQVESVDGAEPFTVDLERCEIRGPQGYRCQFQIAAAERNALLEGRDDVGMTLKQLPAIEAWEARIAKEGPFLQASIVGL